MQTISIHRGAPGLSGVLWIRWQTGGAAAGLLTLRDLTLYLLPEVHSRAIEEKKMLFKEFLPKFLNIFGDDNRKGCFDSLFDR